MPVSYYEQLRTNLYADAAAKKAALDAAYDAYTQAQFDASGNVSYRDTGKLGTRDVAYDTEQRQIKSSGEAGGTLRSGQQARNMATSLASYKADVLGKGSQLAADKSAVDTATTSKLAEYSAMYNTPGTSTTPSTTKTTPATNNQKITQPPARTGTPQGPSLLGPGVFKPGSKTTPKKSAPRGAMDPRKIKGA